MSIAEKVTKVTIQEYLDYLETIEGRAEFYAGEIFDMAGGTNAHSLIGLNIGSGLKIALRGGPCIVYGPDANLAIDAAEAAVMPDVHVVCGEEVPSAQNPNLNTNAILVVEVLSPATGSYDRGGKFNRYKLVPNLLEYVLVEQSEPHVEVLRKQPSGLWTFNSYDGLQENIELVSLGLTLRMAAIYEQVEFVKKKPLIRP